MEKAFDKKREEWIYHGLFLSLCCVVFFLPIRAHYSNIAVGVAAGLWLLNYRANRPWFSQDFIRPIIIFTSLYWILVFGLLYTDNMKSGWSVLEKKLALLILPLIFIASPINNKQIKIICFTLLVATLATSIYCYFKTFQIIVAENLPLTAILNESRFQNLFFSQYIPIHPAYLSNLLILSILFIFFWLKDFKSWVKMLLILLALFFALTILILMARASFVGVIGVFLGVLVFKAIETKRLSILFGGVIFLMLLAVGLFRYVPTIQERFFESIGSFNEMVEDPDQYRSLPIHAKVWYCAMNSNHGVQVIFGHGSGDEHDVLNRCYLDHGWNVIASFGSDSHNEYLSSYIRNGIIGVLLWLFALGYAAYLAFRHRNVMYLSFVILTVIAALSESILRSQISLLSYAIFNACFAKYVINQTYSSPEKKVA